MKFAWITLCTLTTTVFSGGVKAAPAGTLLFAQPGTLVVGESGHTRAATRGDVLHTGERLVTPPGAIAQVRLPDGSLMGIRSDSELKVEQAPTGNDNRPPVFTLVSGVARVIGSELMDPKKASRFAIQSPTASLKLNAADLELAVVKADGKSQPGSNAPGSYLRLLIGSASLASASLANANSSTALSPRQVIFAGTASEPPVTLTAPSGNLFANERTSRAAPAGNAVAEKNSTAALAATSPKLITLMAQARSLAQQPLRITAPVVRPCTRFIAKTCIP